MHAREFVTFADAISILSKSSAQRCIEHSETLMPGTQIPRPRLRQRSSPQREIPDSRFDPAFSHAAHYPSSSSIHHNCSSADHLIPPSQYTPSRIAHTSLCSPACKELISYYSICGEAVIGKYTSITDRIKHKVLGRRLNRRAQPYRSSACCSSEKKCLLLRRNVIELTDADALSLKVANLLATFKHFSAGNRRTSANIKNLRKEII